MRRLLIMMSSLLGTASAMAQTAQAIGKNGKFADPATVVSLPSSGVSSMGQVTVALVIVLGILFAAAWAMRQFKLFTRNGQTMIEVVQGVSIGPKERAVLIKVQNRRLLLGVAPGCVNLLLELSPDDSNGEPVVPPVDINTPNFKALLKRSMGLS